MSEIWVKWSERRVEWGFQLHLAVFVSGWGLFSLLSREHIMITTEQSLWQLSELQPLMKTENSLYVKLLTTRSSGLSRVTT